MKPRITGAVLLAPISMWLVFALLGLFSSEPAAGFGFGILAMIFAYAGMLFIGLPILFALNRFGATRWWQVTLAGFPVPAILTGLNNAYAVLFFGLCGAFVALIAWFIAYFRLDQPNESSVESGGHT